MNRGFGACLHRTTKTRTKSFDTSMYTTMPFFAQPQIAQPLHPHQFVPVEHCVAARPVPDPKMATTVSKSHKPVAFAQMSSTFNPHIPLVQTTLMFPPKQVKQVYDCRTGSPFFFVPNL